MKRFEAWKDPKERKGMVLALGHTFKYVALTAVVCFLCIILVYKNTAFQEKIQTAVKTVTSFVPTDISIPEMTSVQTEGNPEAEGFIFADSDSRLLTEEELEALTDEELAIARNELYARRGRMFSGKWGDYFNSKSWYEPSISGDEFNEEVIFNQFEKSNRDLIVTTERRRKN